MVMQKHNSKVLQNQNPKSNRYPGGNPRSTLPFKPNIAQKLAVAAGIAFSLGFINVMPIQANRFEFQQQVGEEQLSGVFEGTDKNADGVVDLSELESFEARWGSYTWTKEDLEVFSWGEKTISQNQEKIYGINGLNLFARGRQQLKSQALQVWNREVSTPEGQSKNQGIYGIEYAANTPDNLLFSQEQLSLEINHNHQSPVDISVLMMLLLVGITGLLVLNPYGFSVHPPENKPCSSSGKI